MFTGVTGGLIIPWSGVRVPPGLLNNSTQGRTHRQAPAKQGLFLFPDFPLASPCGPKRLHAVPDSVPRWTWAYGPVEELVRDNPQIVFRCGCFVVAHPFADHERRVPFLLQFLLTSHPHVGPRSGPHLHTSRPARHMARVSVLRNWVFYNGQLRFALCCAACCYRR